MTDRVADALFAVAKAQRDIAKASERQATAGETMVAIQAKALEVQLANLKTSAALEQLLQSQLQPHG